MDPVESPIEWVKRTHAVIVAIEEYPALGPKWALPGVARQAADFARWLIRDREVPAENVWVFSSGGDRAPFVELQIPDKHIEPAEAGPINRFFAELKTIWPDGRLLLIYWVGHAFMARDRSRRLILSDAIPDQKANLDIEQLVNLLRSDLAGTFRRQIGFIDTCARFFETLQATTDLPEGGLSRAKFSPNAIEQNFYFAASSGEYGTKDLFGPCILGLLQRLPANQWPPERGWMRTRIEEEFEKVEKEARATQRPAWLEYRQGLDNISSRGVLPTPSDIQEISERAGVPVYHLERLTELAAKCGKLADSAARDTLYDLMAPAANKLFRPKETREDLKRDLLRLIAGTVERGLMTELIRRIKVIDGDSDQAFHFDRAARSVEQVSAFWSLLARIPLPVERARTLYKASHRLHADEDEPGSLGKIVYLLSDLGADEPLVEFLLRVVAESPESTYCKDLQDWLGSQSKWVDMIGKVQVRLQAEANGTTHLLVAIDKAKDAWRVSRAWLWPAAADFPSELAALEVQGDLASDINGLLNEAEELSIGKAAHQVRLEVLVPSELLHLERGLLLSKMPGYEADPEKQYPVVLRWRERMAAPTRVFHFRSGLWKKTSHLIRDRIRRQRRAFWIRGEYDRDDFAKQFGEGTVGELIGIPLSSDGNSRAELIELICSAGLPFACWPRVATADLEAAKVSIGKLLRDHTFYDLPSAIHAQRPKALEDILLLWDDAQRNPYDRKYADVSQRGQDDGQPNRGN